jgi:8-hydroxy-5-deazaflavin:NADPH oxidoreductase
MRIGVLGTGVVGETLATKLVELGHEVRMGSREAGNQKARAWVEAAGPGASEGAFADAAGFGEVVVNCTSGANSLEALEAAGAGNLGGKLLIDVANALDFSGGMPPTLSVANSDSLGEQIQRTFPDAKVVKALNTVNCAVMVDPASVPGNHDIFVCGDDEGAKQQTAELLQSFGWPADRIRDLGGIQSARATEMYLPLWLSLMRSLGTASFNIAVIEA